MELDSFYSQQTGGHGSDRHVQDTEFTIQFHSKSALVGQITVRRPPE